MPPQEYREERHDHVTAYRHTKPDAQRARKAVGPPAGIALQLSELTQDVTSALIDPFAVFGQPQLPGGSIEERNAEFLLQLGDGMAYR